MSWPVGLPLGTVNFGAAVVMQSGENLPMRVTIDIVLANDAPAKSLVWRPTGQPIVGVTTVFTSDEGTGSHTMQLPLCDSVGMGYGNGTAIVLDDTHEFTHLYRARIEYLSPNRAKGFDNLTVVKTFALTAESSPGDIDDLLLIPTSPGTFGIPVAVPALWAEQVDAAEAAALAAQAAAEAAAEAGGGGTGDALAVAGQETTPALRALDGGGAEALGYIYPPWGYGGTSTDKNAASPTLIDVEETGGNVILLPGLGFSTRDNGIATPWNPTYAGNVGSGTQKAQTIYREFGFIPNEPDAVAGQSVYTIFAFPNAMSLTQTETGQLEFKFRNSALAIFTATTTAVVNPKVPFRGRVTLKPNDADNGGVWSVLFETLDPRTGQYTEFEPIILGAVGVTEYKSILTDQTATPYTDQSALVGTNATGQVLKGGFLYFTQRIGAPDAAPTLDLRAKNWTPGATTTVDGAGKTWTIRNPFTSASAPQTNWATESGLFVCAGEKVHLTGAPGADVATTPGFYPLITASGGFKWEATPAAVTAYRENNQIVNLGATPAIKRAAMTVDANGNLVIKAAALLLGLARMATESYADGKAAAARNAAIVAANSYAQSITDDLLGTIANGVAYNESESITTAGVQRISGGLVWESNGPTYFLPPMGVGDASQIDQEMLLAQAPGINQTAIDPVTDEVGITGGYGATPTYLTTTSDSASAPAAGSFRKIIRDFQTVWWADHDAKLLVVPNQAMIDAALANSDKALHIYLDDTPVSGNAQWLRILFRNATFDFAAIPGGLILHGGGAPGPVPYGTLTTAAASGTYTTLAPLVLQTAAGGADFGKTKLKAGIHVDVIELVSGNWVRRATKMTVESVDKAAGTITVSGTVSATAAIGCKVIYNPDRAGINYTPGRLGVRMGIGGYGFNDMFGPVGTKPNLPAGNIIMRNLALRSNWGGDVIDTGDANDFTIRFWSDNVWLDHCDFSNPDPFHDTMWQVGTGCRNIGTTYTAFRSHYKAVNHFGGVTGTGGQNPDGTTPTPNEHPFPPKASNPLEFWTAENPGPYRYQPSVVGAHGNPNGSPIVIITAQHEHALFEGLGQRSPKIDHFGEVHILNSVIKNWGLPASDPALNVTSYFPRLSDDPPGKVPPIISNDGAKTLLENVSFIPDPNLPVDAKGIKRTATGDSPAGFVKTRNTVFYPAANTGVVPVNETDNPDSTFPDFASRYSYTPEPAALYEARVLNGAGAGTQSKMWKLIGVASVAATIKANDSGTELGTGGTEAAVDKINFRNNLTASYDPVTRDLIVDASAASTPDATTSVKGIVQLQAAVDVPGVEANATKAPTPKAVADAIGAAATPDATTSVKGKVMLKATVASGDTDATKAPTPKAVADAITAALGSLSGATLDATGHFTPGQQRHTAQQATLMKPSVAVAESYPRVQAPIANMSGNALTAGRILATGVRMLKGDVISGVKFTSGNTAGATLTHRWVVLLDSTFKVLATSADDTSAAWTANTEQSFTFGSPAPLTLSADGLYYFGLCVAGTTMPTLQGLVSTGSKLLDAPMVVGYLAATGQTTPPAVNTDLSGTAAAFGGGIPYAVVI